MSATLFWTVLGMAAVTYLPRALPLALLGRLSLPARALAFLRSVPYAVLGALIVPGVLEAGPEPWMGVVSGAAAAALAWFGVPLLGVLFGAIATMVVMVTIA